MLKEIPERNHRNYQYFSRPKIIHTNMGLGYFRLRTIYPAGQNVSLELMFAKFATTKNREKLNPLKVSSNRCICLKTALEMCKIVQQLEFEPPTFRFLNWFQVRRSIELSVPLPKNTKVLPEPFILWISRADNTIVNFCAL